VRSLSVTLTPFSTASKAEPPFISTFHASAFAAMPWFQVDITIGPFTLSSKATPINSDACDGLTRLIAAPANPNFMKSRRFVPIAF
jgi:hypothetical protein